MSCCLMRNFSVKQKKPKKPSIWSKKGSFFSRKESFCDIFQAQLFVTKAIKRLNYFTIMQVGKM